MRKLKIASTIVLTVGFLALITACNMNAETHEHTFSEDWTTDETYHWHAATCEHTDEVSEKAEHTFGEWTVTTAATEDAKGSREKSCTICGYKVTEEIAKLDHKHEVGTKHEAVAGTCVKKATIEYYDCKNSNCKSKLDKDGKELTSVEGTIDAANHTGTATTWTKTATTHKETYDCCKAVKTAEADHTFGEWKSNNNATTEADGTKTRTCSACGYAETVTDVGTKIVKTPTFSAAAGAIAKGTNVTITCATAGAKIYYTTDGTEPTATSLEYADAINITAAATVKAIAVKDGLKDSAVAIANYEINVNDFSKCIVGDFILKDRTILSKDGTPESGTVAAVIARAAGNGKPALGVGIVHNKEGLEWCTENASGYIKNIEKLQVDAETASIGYVDGSNSWDLLVDACSDLKSATEKSAETVEIVAEKYPAFNFCRKYGTVNNLSGDLANGWYLPTVAELRTIFQNLSTVDASLLKAGGNQFGENDYMSCCQNPDFNSDTICFYNYGFTLISKNTPVNVCAVRAFN